MSLDQIAALSRLIRQLRETIYFRNEHRYAHEREWETEAQEASREKSNRQRHLEWDKETEVMIARCLKGENVAVEQA